MRRSGQLPHAWIADHTRWMRKGDTYDSLKTMLQLTAQTYRRAVWANQPHYVEIWCEKDAVAGILLEETEVYDVPLMVARGFSSESFLFNSAEALKATKKPCYIYYFGDWDPSGVLIAQKVEDGLRRLAPSIEIHFERTTVTPEQIATWQLPTRPTKESSHSRQFTGDSVEIDAISPSVLRSLVRECLNQHLDTEALRGTIVAEKSEREILQQWAKSFTDVA
jgi:hypothetical protein